MASQQAESQPRAVPIGVSLPPEQVKELRRLSERDLTSVSHIVRLALKDYLANDSQSATAQEEVSA